MSIVLEIHEYTKYFIPMCTYLLGSVIIYFLLRASYLFWSRQKNHDICEKHICLFLLA